jgi:RecA/RadA recombinase
MSDTHNVNGVDVPDPQDPKAELQMSLPSIKAVPVEQRIPAGMSELDDEPPIMEEERLLILKHSALIEDFYKEISPITDEIKFFEETQDPVVMMLAGCISAYITSYPNELPSRDMLLLQFQRHYAEDCKDLNSVATLKRTVDEWYNTEQTFNEEFCKDRLYRLLVQYRKQTMIRQASGDAELFEQSHEAYHKAVLSNPFTVVKRSNPFESLESMAQSIEDTEKYPTGLWYFDKLMAEGAMLGEAIGVLAAPSGGKTTCALELVYHQTYNDKYVAHISTEQKYDGDLTIRAMSLVTGKPRSFYEGGINHWSQDQKVELHNKMAKFKEYHHFFDYTQTKPTNIEELLAPVEQMIAEDKKPVYVIIDWWGAIKDAMIAEKMQTVRNVDQTQVRMDSRLWLDKITKRAKHLGVIPIIFHQLSGQAAGKRGGSIATAQDAQEDKQFGNYFDFCIVFGPPDGDKNFKINSGKARRAENLVLDANLDGANCRIIEKKVDAFDMSSINQFMTSTSISTEQSQEEFG